MTSPCDKVLIITGPTACGKSALAAELAKRFNGEIINADSQQVYSELPILTNQPNKNTKEKAKHHLFGYIDPREKLYSVNSWINDFDKIIKKIRKKHKLPIICGGSGLYIDCLINGLSMIPDIPQNIRNKIRLKMIHNGPQKLHYELSQLDPNAKKTIAPCDTTRISRAMEVVIATGKPISFWQKQENYKIINPNHAKIILVNPERSIWHKQSVIRIHNMIYEGVVDEIKNAKVEEWLKESPLKKAIGLNSLLEYINNKKSLEQAISKMITDTKRYGKRQSTWFRHHLKPDVILSDLDDPQQSKKIAILIRQIKNLSG